MENFYLFMRLKHDEIVFGPWNRKFIMYFLGQKGLHKFPVFVHL